MDRAERRRVQRAGVEWMQRAGVSESVLLWYLSKEEGGEVRIPAKHFEEGVVQRWGVEMGVEGQELVVRMVKRAVS